MAARVPPRRWLTRPVCLACFLVLLFVFEEAVTGGAISRDVGSLLGWVPPPGATGPRRHPPGKPAAAARAQVAAGALTSAFRAAANSAAKPKPAAVAAEPTPTDKAVSAAVAAEAAALFVADTPGAPLAPVWSSSQWCIDAGVKFNPSSVSPGFGDRAVDGGKTPPSPCPRDPATNPGLSLSESEAHAGLKHLLAAKIEVRVKQLWTWPPIWFAYGDPIKDIDVSGSAEHGHGVEMHLTRIAFLATRRCCAKPGAVALDVGANMGYYSAYLAAVGCRVLAWEVHPEMLAFLRYNLWLNGAGSRVLVRARAASDTAGASLSMTMPDLRVPESNWGLGGVGGANLGHHTPDARPFEFQTDTLDAATAGLPPGDVCLLKIDVEGHEIAAFRGAKRLLATRRVAHILLEYSPGAYERKRRYAEMSDWPGLLRSWLEGGYVLRQVHDKKALHTAGCEGAYTKRSDKTEWETGLLRPLRVIAPENLDADEADAKLLATGQSNLVYGHHKDCPKLPNGNPRWCDFSPKSLHRTFVHNTDVWAMIDDEEARADFKWESREFWFPT